MDTLLRASFLSLMVAIAGCTLVLPKETTYLRSAQDQATQEEIKGRLGPPVLTTSGERGESVWVYQVREQQPGNRMTPPGMWCDEYVLSFDSQAILRGWTHRSYFHGGEFMPTYCVPDGFKSTS